MKLYLTVTSQCVALGSLVLREGEDLNWVKKTHQERMAVELCSPARHFSALGLVNEAGTGQGRAPFPTDLCVCIAPAFSSFSILPTNEINF